MVISVAIASSNVVFFWGLGAILSGAPEQYLKPVAVNSLFD